MSDRENPQATSTQAPVKSVEDHRDTTQLSDVPDLDGFASSATQTPVRDPNLSSGAFSALSQHYDILSEAGRGNMGSVYKARDRETGGTIALKLIKPEFVSEQETLGLLHGEFLSVRKIRHKNVCRLYDFQRIGGVVCISMEFAEGESLRSVLNRFGGLPLRKGIDLTLQICSGLKEAHAQGVLHRGLKPENVIVDAQGNLKIMDFGMASTAELVARATGTRVHTPTYIAPELLEGKPADCRSDIYSLGLLLYEIFTGKQILRDTDQAESDQKQERQSPARLGGSELPIPVSIERAIFKCIEKDPAKRYQSVAELERDLMASGTRAILASGSEARTRTVLWNREGISTSTGAGTPARVNASSRVTKRNSLILRSLIAAFFVIVALDSLHWARVSQMAKNVTPPSELSAPAPPEFAFDKSSAQTKIARSAGLRSSTSLEDNSEGSPDDLGPFAPKTPAQSVPSQTPASGTAAAFLAKPAPRATEERADRTSAGETGSTYLWIGRFQEEGGARAMAQEIQGLGLPAVVTSKRNPTGQFFVVLSGPFAQPKASGAFDQLQAQGFTNIRVIKNLTLSQ